MKREEEGKNREEEKSSTSTDLEAFQLDSAESGDERFGKKGRINVKRGSSSLVSFASDKSMIVVCTINFRMVLCECS